jgi:FkbM family methyltransferase
LASLARANAAAEDALRVHAKFQRLAEDFAAAVDQSMKISGAAGLEPVRELRLQIAEALLALKEPIDLAIADPLSAITAQCLRSGVRNFPRTAREDELFAQAQKALGSMVPETVAVQGLAALMLAWHAFELENMPSLAKVPASLRPAWLFFLLEAPEIFNNPGDSGRFVHYLEQLCAQLQQEFHKTAGQVEDVSVIFSGSRIFIQSYFNELNLRSVMRARADIIEQILERDGAKLDQLRVLRPIKKKPRIGYVVLYIGDGTESVFLAANLEKMDHERFDIRLYSVQEPVGKIAAVCHAAVDSYVRLPSNVAQAVTQLRQDDLDIVLFATNLTAVSHLLTQIAAHRVARIQVATGASPVTTGFRNMDALVAGEMNEIGDAQDHYTERLVFMPGIFNCYPFHHVLAGLPPPQPVSREAIGIPANVPLFFSAANFYKIIPELSRVWIEILAQVPESRLLLLPFNPNWSSNYSVNAFSLRLLQEIQEAGVAQDRIFLHPPVPTIPDLQELMRLADVYLDPFPFSGACSLYDALEAGLPIVARRGVVTRSRHSNAMLEQAGLSQWVAADNAAYVRNAVTLASDPQKLQAERERLAQVRKSGFTLSDTADYARRLMGALDVLVADWNARADAVHAEEPAHLARRISALSLEAAERIRSFTDQDLLIGVVLPYLRSKGGRRLIDVGACMGAMTMPFLAEDWQAVMFEPDARCHERLTNIVNAYPTFAWLEKAAITVDREGSIPFHIADAPGLSGLSGSPYAADIMVAEVRAIKLSQYIADNGWANADFIKIDAEGHDLAILNSIDFSKVAPRLVMVEFGDTFPGQDRAAIEESMRQMHGRGYQACVVCQRAVGQFERHEWATRLLAIGIDAVPEMPAGLQLLGNILFFRNDDHDFLPSLCDWLEQIVDPRRQGSSPPAA